MGFPLEFVISDPSAAITKVVLAPTCKGVYWLWLNLSWPCDGHAHWRLLHAVVVLVEERHPPGDVVGPRRAAVGVKVRREEVVFRPFASVLVSRPLSQAVGIPPPLGQVAHDGVVVWVSGKELYKSSPGKEGASFQVLIFSLLTRVSARTEGALAAPGETKQAAALSEGRPATLQRVGARLSFAQSLPANVHVVVGHQGICVTAQKEHEVGAFEPTIAIGASFVSGSGSPCTFGVVGAHAAAAGGVQHQRGAAEAVKGAGCVDAHAVLTGHSQPTLVII